jgi:hypothetical protein
MYGCKHIGQPHAANEENKLAIKNHKNANKIDSILVELFYLQSKSNKRKQRFKIEIK